MTHGAVIHGGYIGNNVMIGVNAVVLESARVGNYCMIGACALVVGGADIPDHSLVVGVPGRVRELSDEHKKRLQDPTVNYRRNSRDFHRRRIGTADSQVVTIGGKHRRNLARKPRQLL